MNAWRKKSWKKYESDRTLPTIHHFRDGKGTGVEMRPAIVSGIATASSPFIYWPIFFYSPRSLCENRLTRPSSLLGEYRPGVTRSQVLTAHNVYRFVSLCQDRFIFSQYAGSAHCYNIRYASKQNLYKSKVRTIYNSGKQTITYTATITREILFNL